MSPSPPEQPAREATTPARPRATGLNAPISLALTLLAAGLLWSGTIRGDATPYGDGSRIMPWLSFLAGQKGYAAWQPYRNGGYPLFADPEQFWFLAPFVDPASANANLALNLALFALLVMVAAAGWVLARRLGLSPLWALVAGVLMSFNELTVHNEQSARFAFLINTISLLVLLAVLAGRRMGSAQVALLIVCTGVSLAVSFQYALLHALAMLAWFLWSDSEDWFVGPRRLISAISKTAAIALTSLLLGAVVILPYLGHMPEALHNARAGIYEPVLPEGPFAVARLLLPFIPSDMPIYLGLPAMMAAALAAAHGIPPPASRSMRMFVLIGLFAMAFVLMCLPIIGPWVSSIYSVVPVLSTLRQFLLAALAMTIAASLFAGIVFDRLASEPVASLSRRTRATIAILLAASAASALAFGMEETTAGAVVFGAGALIGAAYLAWTALGGRGLTGIERSTIGRAGLLSVVLSLAAIAPVAFRETTTDRGVKLHVDNAPTHPRLLEIIRGSEEMDRRVRSDFVGPLSLRSEMRSGAGFSIYFPAAFAYSLAYLNPAYDLSMQRPHWVKPVDCLAFDPLALELLAVDFLLCRKAKLDGKVFAGFEAVAEEKGVVLLRRTALTSTGLRVFCRFRVAQRLPPEAARGEVLPAFARGELVVEEAPQGLAGGASCPQGMAPLVTNAKFTTRSNAIDIEADAPVAGLMLLPDNHSKHWRATVNGKPAVLTRADFAFIAIPVAAGANLIELRFEDPYLGWGLWISAVAALGVLALALSSLFVGRDRPRRAAETQ